MDCIDGYSWFVPRVSSWKRKVLCLVTMTVQVTACNAISRPERRELTSLGLVLNADHTGHIFLSELSMCDMWALLSLFTPWRGPQSLAPGIPILEMRLSWEPRSILIFCFENWLLVVLSCVKLRWWVIYSAIFFLVPVRNCSPFIEHNTKIQP